MRWALGGVAAVAVVTGIVLVSLLAKVGRELVSVREDVAATRDGLGLALAIREQYIHEAHTIIVGDDSHVGHHDEWVAQVEEQANELQGRVPAEDEWRLDAVAETSGAIDSRFAGEVVPGVLADDRARVMSAHEEILDLSEEAVAHSDALVASLDTRMRGSQHAARSALELSVFAGCSGLGLALLLAVLYSWRLRRTFVGPLRKLARAANRVGGEPRSEPLHVRGPAELQTLARTLEWMHGQIGHRERQLVTQARLITIGNIGAGVAQEIHSPLAVLQRRVSAMIEESPGGELEEELRIVDEEVACCQRIVEDLLTLATTPRIEKVPLGTRDLVADAVAHFRLSHPGVSKPHLDVEEARIVGDPVRLRQVLTNLLENATLASTPDEPVEVRGRVRDDHYELVVADRGAGVSEEDRSRIFEPFYSARAGGTGLGLAVCRAVVRGHGGELEHSSREGGGSVFRFTVPAA